MLARLQQFVVLSLLVASAASAALLASFGHVRLGIVVALLILCAHALILGIEFVLLFVVARTERGPHAGAGQLLRAWWGEVLHAPRVFFWRQPFRSRAQPDHLVGSAAGQRGVVLVHGYLCNRGFWNPWLRELRARRVPFVAVDLEPVFGSIDEYPRLIEAAVARVQAATGMPVVLVGHSMGGLAIRAWLRQAGADARVHRVVTIGSPHRGTWLARLSRARNAGQMRLGSDWLATLNAGEPASRRAKFTCFYGDCDNIVFPIASATLPGAANEPVPATAHLHLAFRPAVLDEVRRWLQAPPDARRAPAQEEPRNLIDNS